MSFSRTEAIQYLRAPTTGLWSWADNGQVVVWHDGTTVAFREEIQQILEWLGVRGLPRFGAVVLMLAACKGKIPSAHQLGLMRDGNAKPRRAALVNMARLHVGRQIEQILGEVAVLAKLPPELNKGTYAKCVLAEVISENIPADQLFPGASILPIFSEPLSEDELNAPISDGRDYIEEYCIMARALEGHSPESLALRLRTGLDALPLRSDIELPPDAKARRLIDELTRDPDHGAVGRAARELLAAIRLPRRLGTPEEVALGGLSDISNRGPLDRLLLSELAHDPLTLAVRVALNEALYLRREPPRSEPPTTLSILLDSGVRMWGLPRALAAAVALAAAASGKHFTRVQAWRASGDDLQPVDLLSRAGLIAHLSSLETTADPMEALAAFQEAVAGEEVSQTMLVTHPNVFCDPKFRRMVAAQPCDFVAIVDGLGSFELHATPLSGRAPVSSARLPLDEILGTATRKAPSLRKTGPTDLPAAFRAVPFPFLLPVTGRIDRWARDEDGFIVATMNDRRLIVYRDNRTGARTLATAIPPGKTLWLDRFDGTVHFVKGPCNDRPIRLCSLQEGSEHIRVISLDVEEVSAFHRSSNALLTVEPKSISAWDLTEGTKLAETQRDKTWVRGRYFRDQDSFYFAAWDGSALALKPVSMGSYLKAGMVAAIFDREGMSGPWLLLHNGELVCTATGNTYQPPLPKGLIYLPGNVRVSEDGNRIAVEGNSHAAYLWDLNGGRFESARPGSQLVRDLDPPPMLPVWNLFRIITSVVALPEIGLVLRGRRNSWRHVRPMANGSLHLTELPNFAHKSHFARAHLQPMEIPSKYGCSLQKAEWRTGTKVFLDSRGILHLKSHDASVPEISLVLNEGEVAGWTSDGYVCGPSFFFDELIISQPKMVMERVKWFVEHG